MLQHGDNEPLAVTARLPGAIVMTDGTRTLGEQIFTADEP